MLLRLGYTVIFLFSVLAFAESKSDGLEKSSAAAEEKDIDSEITNSRLRASTGSKSRLSVQTDFSYSGGSVFKPLGPTRPKLSPGPISERNTKVTGNISAKYRLNENNHLNLGTGVGVIRPGFSGQEMQVENPYLSYSNLFGREETQHVLSASLLKYTSKELVDSSALAYEASFYYTYLLNLSKSGWQTGVVFVYSHEIYSKYTEVNSEDTLNTLGLYPFVEYEFNPTYSFRTVYRGMGFYSNRKNYNDYVWDEATQSLGIGVTLTRDIYLYPNLQWVWRDIRLDKTNVSLVANINFF
jgi:hypothetical protein